MAFITKNLVRIYNNGYVLNYNYWPNIYSENNKIVVNNFPAIKYGGQILYFYSMGNLCMYSKSPCSNYKIENLKKKNFYTYDLYWLN